MAELMCCTDPVFLCNDLGKDESDVGRPSSPIESCGGNSLSVKEAVRIAQSNNFMGLICCSQLLVSNLGVEDWTMSMWGRRG